MAPRNCRRRPSTAPHRSDPCGCRQARQRGRRCAVPDCTALPPCRWPAGGLRQRRLAPPIPPQPERCTTSATAPSRPRCTAWCSSTRPASLPTPRPAPGPRCRASSQKNSAPSSNAASWRTAFRGCAAASAATTSSWPSAASGAASARRAVRAGCRRRRRTWWTTAHAVPPGPSPGSNNPPDCLCPDSAYRIAFGPRAGQ